MTYVTVGDPITAANRIVIHRAYGFLVDFSWIYALIRGGSTFSKSKNQEEEQNYCTPNHIHFTKIFIHND